MNKALQSTAFELGTLQSRAAARALLDSRRSVIDLFEIYSNRVEVTTPNFGEWQINRPGSMSRICHFPVGMTFEEAMKASGQPTLRTNGKHIRLDINL